MKNPKFAILAVILVSCLCLCVCSVLTIVLLTAQTSPTPESGNRGPVQLPPVKMPSPPTTKIELNQSNSLVVNGHEIYIGLGGDYQGTVSFVGEDLENMSGCAYVSIQDSVADYIYCIDLLTYELMWQESYILEMETTSSFSLSNNLLTVLRQDLNNAIFVDRFVVKMSALDQTPITGNLKDLVVNVVTEKDPTKLNKFNKLRISNDSARLITEFRCEVDCDDSHTGTANFQYFELKNGTWTIGSKEVRTICRGNYYSDLKCV